MHGQNHIKYLAVLAYGTFWLLMVKGRINALPDDGVTEPKHVGTVLM